MEYNTNELIKKVNDWIDSEFKGFKKEKFEESVLWSKIYCWSVSSDYLMLMLAFNDLSYKFNAKLIVNMEEEDSAKLISKEFKDLYFDELVSSIKEFMEQKKNRINAAKYLHEMVRKYEAHKSKTIDDINTSGSNGDTAIKLVNSIIRDSNR